MARVGRGGWAPGVTGVAANVGAGSSEVTCLVYNWFHSLLTLISALCATSCFVGILTWKVAPATGVGGPQDALCSVDEHVSLSQPTIPAETATDPGGAVPTALSAPQPRPRPQQATSGQSKDHPNSRKQGQGIHCLRYFVFQDTEGACPEHVRVALLVMELSHTATGFILIRVLLMERH